jgi:hypothetical protein
MSTHPDMEVMLQRFFLLTSDVLAAVMGALLCLYFIYGKKQSVGLAAVPIIFGVLFITLPFVIYALLGHSFATVSTARMVRAYISEASVMAIDIMLSTACATIFIRFILNKARLVPGN